MASTVSLGWDVGGWLGKKQAVAVARYSSSSSTLEWLGVSRHFRFSAGDPVDLGSLLTTGMGTEVRAAIDCADRIVVAIDAPLAFSEGFRRLLADPSSMPVPPAREIDSRVAFRDCERWIADEFWKPLSAAFDKLGNNATLAIALSRRLRDAGFGLMPFVSGSFDRQVIEVYPSIMKEARRTSARAVPPVHALLPPDVLPGTDRYDAAICSVVGLVHTVGGRPFGLPDVVGPPDGFPRTETEGWIYSLPAEFILGFH